VATAERTYVDPSALRCLYVHDDRSAGFCAWRRRIGGSLPVSRFGSVEIVNSIRLAVHRGDIDGESARAALDHFDGDVRDGALTLVDMLWRRTLDLARDLSTRHSSTLGTRTLDVLHVATAMTLEHRLFVSYDDRQAALAKKVGLRCIAP
jgi:uncharacterized protein